MAIRMSGLQSGLDTETIVAALVSGYTLQKDNLVKAQTKLTWKKEAWKSMNTSIYSFYSGKLSSARMSSTYSLKKASISDSTKASVTASSSAVNGTQTLRITKLATTGYLTGGVVKSADGSSTKISGSSKLSDVTGGLGNGSITVTSEGTSKEIALTDDMTVNQLIANLKDAGLNANFDETNQRFFVSSKTSGEEHDFTITAGDANGLAALQSLGLYTYNATEEAEYKKWASYGDNTAEAQAALKAVKDEAYAAKEIKVEDRAQTWADKYNAALASIDAANEKIEELKKNDTVLDTDDAASVRARADSLQSDLENNYAQYAVLDDEGNVTSYDTDKMEADGVLDEYNAAKETAANMSTLATSFEEAEKSLSDAQADLTKAADYVKIGDDGKAVADETNSNVVAEVAGENATIRTNSDAAIDDKVAQARAMFTADDGTYGELRSEYKSTSNDAVRVTGSDAEIYLNGAKYVNNTNTFAINGLTIEATAKTDSDITITTNTDIDGIYNSIKDFFKEYNTLITAMDTAYNADSSSGYEPLTSDEKDAMSDDEVEKWETKIKDSLLRKDSTLGNASSSMKNLMAQSIEINGKKYSLSSFGIKTQDYFSSGTNEKGVFHIDGDSDDSVSSGNDDKLRAMIASDPDTVVEFFSQLTQSVYKDLGNRMATSSLSSSFTIYNDKQMDKEYSTYTTKISDKESEISTWEDYYYDKFSSMESALATLNTQQSALSGYFS
jgi:flagellar hook-associated protein 2